MFWDILPWVVAIAVIIWSIRAMANYKRPLSLAEQYPDIDPCGPDGWILLDVFGFGPDAWIQFDDGSWNADPIFFDFIADGLG